MGVDPKKTNKPIAKLLHAAGLDLDAATRLLAEPPTKEEIEKLLAIAPRYGVEIKLPH